MNDIAKTGIIVAGSALISALSAAAVLFKANKHFSERLCFKKSKLRLCGEI